VWPAGSVDTVCPLCWHSHTGTALGQDGSDWSRDLATLISITVTAPVQVNSPNVNAMTIAPQTHRRRRRHHNWHMYYKTVSYLRAAGRQQWNWECLAQFCWCEVADRTTDDIRAQHHWTSTLVNCTVNNTTHHHLHTRPAVWSQLIIIMSRQFLRSGSVWVRVSTPRCGLIRVGMRVSISFQIISHPWVG